ncbi:MAG: acetyl-CoA carboxylase biotin carboxyl carrier protein [Salinisphaera sp.]|nr:acetyl-CoA carboxylase biotin carboxyl carrier protein [Salinisphaera sp.]
MNEDHKPGLTSADVSALLALFDESEWQELELHIGDTSLCVSKRGAGTRAAAEPAPAQPLAAPVADPAPAPQAASVTQADVPAHWVAITAPNVGSFYRAPKPGAPPYVEVDQAVSEDSEVCVIEVMKLFTPVTAGVAGAVRRICVEDGVMVEYGQTMLYIEPE